MQRTVHLRIADCYGNKFSSAEEVESCVHRCAEPLKAVQAVVQREMKYVEDRFSRCAQDCNDEFRDISIGVQEGTQAAANIEKQFYGCISKCVDRHLAMIPSIQYKLEKEIDTIASSKK